MRPTIWLQFFNRLLIVTILTMQIFPAIKSAAQDIGDTKEAAGKPDHISVAYCVDCVPFHFQDEQGEPAGIIIDLWRLWAQKTGITVEFRAAPWDETLAMVGSGVADAHAGLFFNEERDKFLDYGAALRKTDTHVFIHKSLPAISRFEDLSAYRIGVLAKDYVEGFLKERLPQAVIVPYPDYASIISALKEGTLRVFAADTPTGIFHLRQSGMVESFSFSKDLLLYQNDWYAAAQEGNSALIKIINIGMSQISPSEKTEIGRQWAGINKEEKTDAVIISIDRAYSPMTFLNARGHPAGFLVDLWRLWAGKTGRQIRFKASNWKESVESLRNGEADVHAGLFKNDEREQWLKFTPEVYRIGTGLYHRARENIPDDPAKFKRRPLGVIAGSHQETMARSRWPGLRLIAFNSTQELIQALFNGEVYAATVEIPIMNVLLDGLGMRGEIIRKPGLLSINGVHPAILKENEALLTEIERGFAQISRKELEVLEKRWIVNPENRIYASKFQLDDKVVPLNLTLEEKKWLKAHPVIKMGVDRSWPPFEYLDGLGRHSGIVANFIQLIEARLGIRFSSPPNISWQEVIAKIKQSELDIISVLSPTKARDSFLNFTDAYLQAPFVIVRRIGSSPVSGLNDLSGQKVGVVSGYAAEEQVRQEAPHLNLVLAKDISSGLLALSTRKTDAFVANLPSVNHFIQELFLNNLEVGASAGFTLDLAIGVRKDWPVFIEILNKAVASVTEEERKKIFGTEAMAAAKEQETEVSLLKIIISVTLLTLVLIGAIFILNQYLKKIRAKGLSEDLFQSTKVRVVGMGVIGLFIAITIIMAGVVINQIDQRIRKDMGATLGIILKSTQDTLHVWVESNKETLIQLLIAPELLEPVEALLAQPRNKDALVKNSAQETVREFFQTHFEASGKGGFFIIAPDFISISSGRDTRIGSTNLIVQQRKDLIKRVFQGEVVFVPPINSDVSFVGELGEKTIPEPTLFFVGPLRNNQGEVIAAVSIPIDPLKDFSRLIQAARIGKSGEAYAFDKQGYFLTKSRFIGQMEKLELLSNGQKEIHRVRVSDPGGNLMTGFKNAPPQNSRPLTLMAQSAIAGNADSDIQGYRNFRGVPVLGAWLWDENIGLGLTFEIDLEEALEPFYSVRNMIILVLSAIVIFSLILTALSVWIGEQANLTLRRARDNLENRVKDRTQELQESENKIRSVIDSSLDGVIIVNDQGVIQSFNPAAEVIFGYQEGKIAGKNIALLIPESYREKHHKGFARFLETGKAKMIGTVAEVPGLKKDGSTMPIELGISVIEQNERQFFVGMVRDISKRKAAEKELRQAHQQAQSANQSKSDFLANMSHEIRTPMNAIIGMSYLAMKTDLSSKQRNYVSKIMSAGEALLRLINDILDFSKIEAGKLDMEIIEFDLEEVLNNLAALLTHKANDKGLEVIFSLKPDVPRSLTGDPLRLGQILINLADNAVKFTEKGEILIRIEKIREIENKVELRFMVKDSGIGMTKELMGRLFKSFSQSDTSTTRKYGGTGLGLAISRQIVELMNGKIWVESEPGLGSSFLFSAQFGMALEKDEGLRIPDMRGIRVLVVDDSEVARETMKEYLESFSVDVASADSGKAAIRLLEDSPEDRSFDVVLMDSHMPEMDGVKASQIIKKSAKISKIPKIVLVTAYEREEIMQKYHDAHLDGFLLKPFNRSVLYETILEACGHTIDKKPYRKKREDNIDLSLKKIKGAKLLLVEDNAINQQIATELLEGAGFAITIANNGKEAVDLVYKNEFDAVLMDLQMPVMDGFEATEKLRADPNLDDLPIIAMTAHALANEKEKCLKAGMNDHTTKPIEPDKLFETLIKWIKPKARELTEPERESGDTEEKIMEKESLPASLPGIDLAAGLKIVGGNQKLFIKLLKGFKRDFAEAASELEAFVDNSDWDGARRLAHSIKGLSGNLGAMDLYDSSGKLEAAFKNGINDDISDKLNNFDLHLKQVLVSVKTLPTERQEQEAASVGNVEMDLAKITPIYKRLNRLLKESNIEAEHCLEDLKKHFGTGDFQEKIKEIEYHLDVYDFDKAINALNKIGSDLDLAVKGE